jgi:Uma2 family endonuclease
MNAPTAAPRRFTRAEFDRIARTGGFGRLRVELRRGWIVEMSPQYAPHAGLKMELLTALADAVREAGLGLSVWTEASIAFGEHFEPMPDIFVFGREGCPEPMTGAIPGAAVKLIVEVADASLADDLGDKRAEYAEAGLAEYWVADVAARTLHRHANPGPGGFETHTEHPLAEGFQSFTIPGLIVPAGRVR